VTSISAPPYRLASRRNTGRCRVFAADDVAEAFAACRSITIPTQLRSLIRADGRDLIGRFRRLAPKRRAVPIQLWDLRRAGITAGLIASLAAVVAVLYAAVAARPEAQARRGAQPMTRLTSAGSGDSRAGTAAALGQLAAFSGSRAGRSPGPAWRGNGGDGGHGDSRPPPGPGDGGRIARPRLGRAQSASYSHPHGGAAALAGP